MTDTKLKFIVRHGEDTPVSAWFLQAPRTWTGDKNKATRFDDEASALAALDHMIEVRYKPIGATKKEMQNVRSRCVVDQAPQLATA